MSVSEYFEGLVQVFEENGDPDVAFQQSKYMKNQFEYYGMKAPKWTGLLKKYYKDNGYPELSELREFSELCYGYPKRELHYAALETIQRKQKQLPEDFIDQFKWLVLTNSWWDTVDWLAGLIGSHLLNHESLQTQTTDQWNESENMWLIRVSIIHQLKYRDKTDFELMKRYILRHSQSKEFFIRKAQGWALRQYSKFRPDLVKTFVLEHPELSGLTKREALKYVD